MRPSSYSADVTTTGRQFEVVASFSPTGDQPAAIEALSRELGSGRESACLLGATGTGKTFTMANVIARLGKPTLIISHNKTLAAQLYEELREFMPHNSVNYFVSYYDYYQPEAYIPQRDIYIEKDSSRNEELDLLRLAATSNILSRRDVVVVASVSCIFGLGSPVSYASRVLTLTRGTRIGRRDLLLSLQGMQYQRGETDPARGKYRVLGDVVEVWPAYERFAVRLDTFGDVIERIELVNPIGGEVVGEESQFFLFPAVHHVVPEDRMQSTMEAISKELEGRVLELRRQGKLLEAQRLQSRTTYDLEMLAEVGYCSGIENYSRFFDGRAPGERPYTLMDYFDFAPGADARVMKERSAGERAGGEDRLVARPNDRDWLVVIDESHVTIPQLRAMHNGDRARKQVLVDHGFRLPAALDNRPLRFEEFEAIVPQVLFVSATPGEYELSRTGGVVAEQVIRPTGLLDPEVEVHPAQGQVGDLLERCRACAARGQRVLVTALTKKMCERLTEYLDEQGLRVRYLHSEIETLDRICILTDLRAGEFDVLVGVNLLREGLDLPEVSLVCILDADKEGFLRSPTSLIQQMGRAARNVDARVVLYADRVTGAMSRAMEETRRRREKQLAYNAAHGITPRTIEKSIRRGLEVVLKARRTAMEALGEAEESFEAIELARMMEGEMLEAAGAMEFERAAELRDQAAALRSRAQGERVKRSEVEGKTSGGRTSPGAPGTRPRKKGKKR